MPPAYADLAEHTGILVSLIGVFFILCIALVGVIYKIAWGLKTDILGMIGEVWDEMKAIKEKQEQLREQLPKEYLRLEGPGYKALMDVVKDIKEHFEQFTQDCRSGKCTAGRMRP